MPLYSLLRSNGSFGLISVIVPDLFLGPAYNVGSGFCLHLTSLGRDPGHAPKHSKVEVALKLLDKLFVGLPLSFISLRQPLVILLQRLCG